jgi:hypothetical protein
MDVDNSKYVTFLKEEDNNFTIYYLKTQTFKNLKIMSAKGLPFLLEELKPSM